MKIHFIQRVGLLALTMTVTFAAPAAAQLAEISGFITDGTGLGIPRATIEIGDESGTARTATTNERGYYLIAALRPGRWQGEVRAQGFQTASISIILDAGQQARFDSTLSVGTIRDTATVTAESSLVSRRGAAVSTTIDRDHTQRLPLNGRTLHSLLALTPGLTFGDPSFGSGALGPFSVNGQRTSTNAFSIDGVSANLGTNASGLGAGQEVSGAIPGLSAVGSTNTLVSMESLQEVQVYTSSYSPEFGRQPGAQVALTTKSGTNRFAFSLFEYFRDSQFDAADWFANRAGAAKPETQFHNFGASSGGPIVQNRAHYFFTYEGQRIDQPRFAITEVPSTLARASAVAATRPLLNAFPLPNSEPTPGSLWAIFQSGYEASTALDSVSGRGDVHLGPLHLFERISYADSRATNRGRGGSASLNMLRSSETETFTSTLGLTAVSAAGWLIDGRMNVSSHQLRTRDRADDFGGAVPAAAMSLIPGYTNSERSASTLDLSRSGVIINGNSGGSRQRQWNATVSVTRSWGAQIIKGGVDVRHLYPHLQPAETLVAHRSANLANLVAGQFDSVTIQANTPGEPVFNSFAAYVQDTWQAHRRLSLDLGMRWDVNPAPSSNGPLAPTLVSAPQEPFSGIGFVSRERLYATRWTDIAPRVGAVLTVREGAGREIVVRAGGGLFYDLGSGLTGNAIGAGYPYRTSRMLAAASFPIAESLLQPAPRASVPGTSDVYSIPDHLESPRVWQGNATVDFALGSRQAASIGYVTASGHKLLRHEFWLLPPTLNPNFRSIRVISNAARSKYDALQSVFRRRLASGIGSQVQYTYGVSKDNGSSDTGLAGQSIVFGPDGDWGYSDFDVRHNLTAALNFEFTGATSPALSWLAGVNVDLLTTWRSGFAYTPRFVADLGFGALGDLRPDLVPDQPLYIDDPSSPGGRRVNRNAFSIPSPARNGNAPRNLLRGPSAKQVDLAIGRALGMFPGTVRVRLEVFNLFNWPNFGIPVNAVSSALFGQPTRLLSTPASDYGLSSLFARGGPRTLQFVLRYDF